MNDEKINSNLIVKLSFEFALQIVKYAEALEEKRKFASSVFHKDCFVTEEVPRNDVRFFSSLRGGTTKQSFKHSLT